MNSKFNWVIVKLNTLFIIILLQFYLKLLTDSTKWFRGNKNKIVCTKSLQCFQKTPIMMMEFIVFFPLFQRDIWLRAIKKWPINTVQPFLTFLRLLYSYPGKCCFIGKQNFNDNIKSEFKFFLMTLFFYFFLMKFVQTYGKYFTWFA